MLTFKDNNQVYTINGYQFVWSPKARKYIAKFNGEQLLLTPSTLQALVELDDLIGEEY